MGMNSTGEKEPEKTFSVDDLKKIAKRLVDGTPSCFNTVQSVDLCDGRLIVRSESASFSIDISDIMPKASK